MPSHCLPAGVTALSVLLFWSCCGAVTPATEPATPTSQCFGSVGHGRITGAVQLPASGANFVAYSGVGTALGRTYVHASVRDIAVEAYAALALSAPATVYEYGETGLQYGGPIKPHRTHQSGASIDFMVPVRDRAGTSVALPASALNKFGYAWEFDERGRAGELHIDFEAIAAHLLALKQAADRHRVPIERVIFDPRLRALLMRTRHGAQLAGLPFMKQQPWIRHDEHYHVDFKLPCGALAAAWAVSTGHMETAPSPS